MTWRPGDTAVFVCKFDVQGTFTDPTDITFEIRDPEGTVETFRFAEATVTRTATGRYEREYLLEKEGSYRWRWQGTGNCAAADEGHIAVRSSPFA